MLKRLAAAWILCVAAVTAQAAEPEWTHGLSILGASAKPADFKTFDYVVQDVPDGGTLKLAAIGNFDSVNPYIMRGVKAQGIGMMFDTLMAEAPNEVAAAYGLLAEKVRVAEDKSWVEFQLRDNATFHDGSSVMAADVVFTFDALMEKGHPLYRTYYRDVKRAVATAERMVRFEFSVKNNRELPFIVGQLPVLSKASFDGREFDDAGLTPLLGSGPYKVAKIDAPTMIRFERVDDYWGKDVPVNHGRHNIEAIQYDYYLDETVAVEALKAGQYDFRAENIARLWATAYTDSQAKGMVREKIHHKQSAGVQGFFWNQRLPRFADWRVRKALGLAFDFEWSNKKLFHGSYERTQSYFPNTDLAATGAPSEAEIALLEPYRDSLPAAVFEAAVMQPKTDGSGRNRTQLREAKALLEQAGWNVQAGKLVHAEHDAPFAINFLIQSKTFERIISPYIKNLEKLGITATIQLVDSSQFQTRMQSFDFDVMVKVYGQSLTPGNEQKNYWHSEAKEKEGSWNYAGISHAAVDAMIEKIIMAESREELVVAARALDRLLQHLYVATLQWHIPYHRLVYWQKLKRPDDMPDYGLDFPHAWWIDETAN